MMRTARQLLARLTGVMMRTQKPAMVQYHLQIRLPLKRVRIPILLKVTLILFGVKMILSKSDLTSVLQATGLVRVN